MKARYAAMVPRIISTGIVGSFKNLASNGEENIIKDMLMIINISSVILSSYFSSGIV